MKERRGRGGGEEGERMGEGGRRREREGKREREGVRERGCTCKGGREE